MHVIVLQGEGRSFCAGYDLKAFAEAGVGTQGPVWDPIRDFRGMKRNTDDFFSLFRSLKPTICKVQGHAVAGGSDIALSLRSGGDGRRRPHRIHAGPGVGLPDHGDVGVPARRGDGRSGCCSPATRSTDAPRPTGVSCSRRCPLTGSTAAVEELADRMAGVPVNQLVMQKLMINQAYDNMGLQGTQILATLFDGITAPFARGTMVPGAGRHRGVPRRGRVARFGPVDPRGRPAGPGDMTPAPAPSLGEIHPTGKRLRYAGGPASPSSHQ